jgi:hypothetical protein
MGVSPYTSAVPRWTCFEPLAPTPFTCGTEAGTEEDFLRCRGVVN